MTVPGGVRINAVFQDDRGFKANVRMNVGFIPDFSVSTPPAPLGSGLDVWYTQAAAVFTALAAMSNAKIVEQSLEFWFNIAQEPTTETGTYQLVNQKADMTFADGTGQFTRLSIPAPKDGLFETTTQDNLIVVNPASSLLTNLQSAVVGSQTQQALAGGTVHTLMGATRGGGSWGSQFFGGQLKSEKPRRRRVLQGQ